jgi:hypothetical protein
MSDPNHGEPVEPHVSEDESTHVDDVVGRANEGLAEAEAASRDAVTPEEAAAAAEQIDAGEKDYDLSYIEAAGPEPVESAPHADAATTVLPAERAAATDDATAVIPPSETVVPAAATVPAAAAAEPAPAPQPIFVQAPEAPRPRGNRGAAGLIGLLAAVVFGILYLAAALAFGAVDGDVTASTIGTQLVGAVTSWWFWVPVAVFFVGFWLLGAIINRGRWGQWVILGLLVGAVAYGGHLLGQLFEAPFWTLTASQGAELVEGQVLAPLAIVAFILGREITIWFGAWVAARGARVTELNNEAQREYERTLEAGPQLHRM